MSDYGRTAYAGDPRDQEDWDLRHNVAAIMGWKRAEGYDGRWEHPATSVAYLAGDGYTCDDMLVWLVQRCEAVETKTWPGRSDVMLWSSANGWPDEHTAPTLHAALERAVTAVGRAE